MRAMILCAGMSTRLGRLGAERPKPLLPVCGMPILAYGIANLVSHGVSEIVVNTHHLAELFHREIGDGRRFGAHITYVHEPVLLGTGGGLKNALPLLDPGGRDEPFLSINGKLIFDLDVTALADAYHRAGDVLGMMVVRRVPDAKSWGAVNVRDGDVVDILGDGEHMFCGAHVTRPSVMARLPDGEADSIRQGYLPWMRAGGRVAAYEHAGGYFAEHSTPERYVESNWAILDGAALRHPPGHIIGVDPTARIHPRATLVLPVAIGPGARVDAVTVGPHAIVGAGAHVARSVARTIIWDGATADASNAGDDIVTR